MRKKNWKRHRTALEERAGLNSDRIAAEMRGRMKSYGFADGNGHDIDRGVQCWPDQARRMAQDYADERGITVTYWEEDAPADEDGANSTCIDIAPSSKAGDGD